jgi:hypothetical protein
MRSWRGVLNSTSDKVCLDLWNRHYSIGLLFVHGEVYSIQHVIKFVLTFETAIIL